jgi:hypothetical protein
MVYRYGEQAMGSGPDILTIVGIHETTGHGPESQDFLLLVFSITSLSGVTRVRIPVQIDIHSACKSAPVPIEIGTCSDANRHTLFRVS